jgi:septum formation protein
MIILASASTWRATLLREWGFFFEIRPTDVDEETEKKSIHDPKSLVEALALKKYTACPRYSPAEIILAADTIIALHDQTIGKPVDRLEAKQIITALQNQTHQVWTGVCINGQTFSDVASVTFKPMTETQVETYLDTNDWVGKAGAYQVQKSIKPFIEKIDGDINTVIGLPKSTLDYLKEG